MAADAGVAFSAAPPCGQAGGWSGEDHTHWGSVFGVHRKVHCGFIYHGRESGDWHVLGSSTCVIRRKWWVHACCHTGDVCGVSLLVLKSTMLTCGKVC